MACEGLKVSGISISGRLLRAVVVFSSDVL